MAASCISIPFHFSYLIRLPSAPLLLDFVMCLPLPGHDLGQCGFGGFRRTAQFCWHSRRYFQKKSGSAWPSHGLLTGVCGLELSHLFWILLTWGWWVHSNYLPFSRAHLDSTKQAISERYSQVTAIRTWWQGTCFFVIGPCMDLAPDRVCSLWIPPAQIEVAPTLVSILSFFWVLLGLWVKIPIK